MDKITDWQRTGQKLFFITEELLCCLSYILGELNYVTLLERDPTQIIQFNEKSLLFCFIYAYIHFSLVCVIFKKA